MESTAQRLVQDATAIWDAGVAAVRADRLIADNVNWEDDCLCIGDLVIDRSEFDRVLIVGGGKAVASMASELEQRLAPRVPVYGWVNVPEGTADDSMRGSVRIFEARPAGMNEPTPAVLEGTSRILELVSKANSRDLVLAVLSGGGSALLAAPIDGVSLDDKLQLTRHLSMSGADIGDLNTVRKQLSRIKGGGLKRACKTARLMTLVLSDVLGDPLDVIASGPTVENTSTANDALAVLKKYDPSRTLPPSIYHAIERSHSVTCTRTSLHAGHEDVLVLGNNATAVDAAGVKAESLGYSHAMTSARQSEGAAEAVGRHLAEMAVTMLADRDAGKQTPDCLISGGEPTVRLAPPAVRGKGGRNTHVVLAAMARLKEMNCPHSLLDRILIMSGGTDGEDGPTNAAGAIVTSQVWRRAAELGLDPNDYLSRSDSYHFFAQASGLLITGPTHTNVCDLRVMCVCQVGADCC
jgi:glycerate-2-kinase